MINYISASQLTSYANVFVATITLKLDTVREVAIVGSLDCFARCNMGLGTIRAGSTVDRAHGYDLDGDWRSGYCLCSNQGFKIR
jgi:hypothetical protein